MGFRIRTTSPRSTRERLPPWTWRSVRAETSSTPTYTYSAAGTYNVGLMVTDSSGLTSTDHVTITAGNSPPTAFIDSPSGSLTWRVGQSINFSGHATDPE